MVLFMIQHPAKSKPLNKSNQLVGIVTELVILAARRIERSFAQHTTKIAVIVIKRDIFGLYASQNQSS